MHLNGIKVGTITDERLEPDTLDAVVIMSIKSGIKLPTDSTASIGSESILGSKYVRLEPSSEKTYTAAGGPITKTKDFYSLEDQVGDIIFLASGGGNKDE